MRFPPCLTWREKPLALQLSESWWEAGVRARAGVSIATCSLPVPYCLCMPSQSFCAVSPMPLLPLYPSAALLLIFAVHQQAPSLQPAAWSMCSSQAL